MSRRRFSWNLWLWLQVALASFRYQRKITEESEPDERSEMKLTSPKDTQATTLPDEFKSVRSWNTESSISSILVTTDGIVYGTRYGLVSLVKFREDETIAHMRDQQLINNIRNPEEQDVVYHSRPNRWWVGNNEVLSIARIDDGYLVVDGIKMLLLNRKGTQLIRGLYSGLILATTTHYGLFGTLNAVGIVDLTAEPFETRCFKEVVNCDLRVELGEPIHSAAIMGNTAVCCGQRNAYVIDLVDPLGEKTIITAIDPITSIAFCEAMVLVMATTNGVCQSWDVIHSKPLAAFNEHDGAVYAMDITQDGTKAAIGSSAVHAGDFTVYIWDTHLGTLLYRLTHHTDLISGVAFTPKGSLLVTASWDGTIHQVDLKYGDRSRFFLFLREARKSLPDDVLKHIFSFLIR